MNRTIFCIMPVTLADYPNCADNRERKYIRAVNSFLASDYQHKQLIIISDGCERTVSIYEQRFIECHEIRCIPLQKQELFSGMVRQAGIKHINQVGMPTDIICYLDSDDMLGKTHLSQIANQIKSYDFVYYNDYLHKNPVENNIRIVEPEPCRIGASSIAHLNNPLYSWEGCNGYGHDFRFIYKIMNLTNNYRKIYGCEYLVCHTNDYDY